MIYFVAILEILGLGVVIAEPIPPYAIPVTSSRPSARHHGVQGGGLYCHCKGGDVGVRGPDQIRDWVDFPDFARISRPIVEGASRASNLYRILDRGDVVARDVPGSPSVPRRQERGIGSPAWGNMDYAGPLLLLLFEKQMAMVIAGWEFKGVREFKRRQKGTFLFLERRQREETKGTFLFLERRQREETKGTFLFLGGVRGL